VRQQGLLLCSSSGGGGGGGGSILAAAAAAEAFGGRGLRVPADCLSAPPPICRMILGCFRLRKTVKVGQCCSRQNPHFSLQAHLSFITSAFKFLYLLLQ
jgi:hypothetical protein